MSDATTDSAVPDWLRRQLLALVLALAGVTWTAVESKADGHRAERLERLETGLALLAQTVSAHTSQLDHPHGVASTSAAARADLSQRLTVVEHGLSTLRSNLVALSSAVDRLTDSVNRVALSLPRPSPDRRARP